MNIQTLRRDRCAACGQSHLEPFRKIENFPALPICTDQKRNEDILGPLDVAFCQSCGLIQLQQLMPLEVIYEFPHSEGLGGVWGQHYLEFEKFIRKQSSLINSTQALEVGAGRGQIAQILAKDCKLSVIEPNYGGPREGISVINDFFLTSRMQNLRGTFDLVYSSHTLEHFYDFREYFASSQLVLREGGHIVTAIPNLESALQAGFANAFHFEHTAVLTLPIILQLHSEFGFNVTGITYYRDHSIYISAQYTGRATPIATSTGPYMCYLFDRFYNQMIAAKKKTESLLKPGIPHFLFGASQLSQFLFACGLDENHFDGLLDNASQKDGKRLYGTSLHSEVPARLIAREMNRAQIFINGGPYSAEIHKQLEQSLPKTIELICI